MCVIGTFECIRPPWQLSKNCPQLEKTGSSQAILPLERGQPPSHNRSMQETPALSLHFKTTLKSHPAGNYPVGRAEAFVKSVLQPSFSLCSFLLPVLPSTINPQSTSLINLLSAKLHLSICFSKNPTCNNPNVKMKWNNPHKVLCPRPAREQIFKEWIDCYY